MKKSEVPQDKSNFNDLYYAVDDNGNYTTAISSGWDPKKIALENAMQEISERTAIAKVKVLNDETSPIEYYMEFHKMDMNILASYVGMWKWNGSLDFFYWPLDGFGNGAVILQFKAVHVLLDD